MANGQDDRGRSAVSPADLPRSGWRDALKRAWTESGRDNLSLVAAGVAFYAFLALAPLLAAVVLAYGVFADPQTIMGHIQSLAEIMPADAAQLVGDQLAGIYKSAQDKGGLGLAFALLLALYGAMRGATAIITALNIVYEQQETRGFLRSNLLALAITAGGVLVAVAGLTAMSMLALVDELVGGGAIVHGLVRVATWTGAALIACAVIAAIYRYGPSRAPAQWRWTSPGAIAATVIWVFATLLFGLYVSNFADYNATYGSLGAVVALLMWFYVSAYVILMGAELNAELEHQTERDSTTGPEAPMGERRAKMADTLGEVPA